MKKTIIKRMLAFVIDLLLLNLSYYLILKLLNSFLDINEKITLFIHPFLFHNFQFNASSIIVYLSIVLLNWVIAPVAIGGTIGMKMLKLSVVNQSNNRKISFFKSILRYICSCISFIILGIGFIIALFSKNSETLHDKLSKTKVVN